MNKINTIGLALFFIIITIATIALKPIVNNEYEYKVIVANTSEHTISSISIFGGGEQSGEIGPIYPGKQRHYIFIPSEDGTLEYLVKQNNHELKGIIATDLKKGETGEVYVVVGEMYKVRIRKDLGF